MTGLPPAARAVAVAVTDAVAAARSGDAPALDEASLVLSTLDSTVVLGDVVRMLIEERYPDGLTGDDVRAVVERTARCADVDPTVLVALVAGALGVHPDEADPQAAGEVATARHAAVLIAALLDGRPVAGYLSAALSEIRRAETMEMP